MERGRRAPAFRPAVAGEVGGSGGMISETHREIMIDCVLYTQSGCCCEQAPQETVVYRYGACTYTYMYMHIAFLMPTLSSHHCSLYSLLPSERSKDSH